MKTSNKLIGFLLALVMVVGCTDDFEEMNIDPNRPSLVPAANLFTQAQFSLSNRIWSRADNFEFAMLMVQHFAQNEYAEDSRYNQGPSNFSTSWQVYYAGILADLEEAAVLTMANESLPDQVVQNRLAQIEILRVYAFQMITDMWGDVPYSQALQPDEFSSPVYDDQSDIYAGLVAEVNAALAKIDTGFPGFESGDIIYSGDMELWRRFGNSLKLRIGMRMIDAPAPSGINPSNVVAEALNAGVFESSDQSAVFPFEAQQAIANPFYVDALTRDDFAVSEILVESLKDRNDPRLEFYANPTPEGDIVGMPYGLTDPEAFALKSSTSRPNDMIREATAPAILLSYAEVEFFRAEAIERGIVGGDASAAFRNAVTASMQRWGVDAADIVAYLAANPYDPINWEESIGYEKWVALYTQGVEAWAEWRRLDFPVLPVPTAAVIDQIPVRAFYPAVEQEANTENLEAVGINDMVTPMWWDVN